MPVRLAACDPCRTSKVSCDHAVPCGRCKESASDCTYRQRPFKRRRLEQEISLPPRTRTDFHQPSPAESSSSTPNVYPNPGYQGTSSHTSIFDQVKASGGAADVLTQPQPSISLETTGSLEDYEIARHVKLIEEVRLLDIKASAQLVSQWISQGINLALAGPLVMSCVETVEKFFSTRSGAGLVDMLFRSSRQLPASDGTMSVSMFAERSCRNDPGWATLGMFLVALSRAAEDTSFCQPLYSTRAGQQRFQKMALHQADQCLDICLSLDCLNDLQLILQYENFIAHSMIDGDQSEFRFVRVVLRLADHIRLSFLA